jgi:hypothetical protein
VGISGKRRKVLERRSKQREQLPELVYPGGPTELSADLGLIMVGLIEDHPTLRRGTVDREILVGLVEHWLRSNKPDLDVAGEEAVDSLKRLHADGWFLIRDKRLHVTAPGMDPANAVPVNATMRITP